MSRTRSRVLSALSEEIAALARAVVPSTAIVTGQTRDFGGGSGSAWLYDDRHLVTNNHVVEHLVAPVWVRFPSCQDTRAEVIGRDALTDLAVLEVPPQSADPLALRTRGARLGELCFAFGSPLGNYPESMSLGIVSGLERSLPPKSGRHIYDIIQTDCAINPGNSGGPLIDVDGEVIGVNTAGIQGAEGIGFAVPADTVAGIIPELLAYGSIARASLGVSVAPQRREEWVDGERLVVTAIRPTAAGPFEQGDVLLTVGPHEVRNRQDLFRILRRDAIGSRVPVTVWRKHGRFTFECSPAELQQRP